MLIPLYLQFGKYKPDWGDVPTWAAAIFALAAGVVAWRAFVVSLQALQVSTKAHETSHKLLEVELERDQEARQDRRDRDEAERRAQAEQVAVWIDENQKLSSMQAAALAAHIRNASTLPVFEVELTMDPVDAAKSRTVESLHSLGPGRTKLFWPDDRSLMYESEIGPQFTARLRFTDAAGIRWERDPRGKLAELPSGS